MSDDLIDLDGGQTRMEAAFGSDDGDNDSSAIVAKEEASLYGENHKGVVIGFDESHRFFDDESELGCDSGLRDVQYPDQRPTFDEIESFDVLTTKAPVWRYEEEVRAMRLFREEDRPIGTDPDGMPIVLVDFPKELVQQVIVGAQAEEALLARCQKALRDNEMPWVSVKKVALSRRDFSLQLEAS